MRTVSRRRICHCGCNSRCHNQSSSHHNSTELDSCQGLCGLTHRETTRVNTALLEDRERWTNGYRKAGYCARFISIGIIFIDIDSEIFSHILSIYDLCDHNTVSENTTYYCDK